MKKLISAILSAVILITALCACGGSPDRSSAQSVSGAASEYDFGALRQLRRSAGHQTAQLPNIIFDGTVRVPDVNEVYRLTLEYNPSYYSHFGKLSQILTGKPDPKYTTETNGSLNTRIYSAGDSTLSASPRQFALSQAFSRGLTPTVETVRAYRGEAFSKRPRLLLDGSFTMEQAAAQVTELLEQLKQFEPDMDFNIRTAFTYQVDDTHYGYEFYIERLYKGINIDSYIAYSNTVSDESMALKGNVLRDGTCMRIYITDSKGCGGWTIANPNDIYRVKNAMPLADRFITFDSALQALSDAAVDSSHGFKVQSAEFCYDMSWRISCKSGDSFIADRSKAFANPMWVFIADREGDPAVPDTARDAHFTFFVDAVTGDTYLYSEGTIN